MSATPAQLEEILADFRELDEPEDYFEELVRFGRELQELPPERRRPENRVRGCVSAVHIEGEKRDGRMYFEACADSHLVRGLVAVVLRGLNGLTPEEVLAVDPAVLKEAGLTRSLTPSRANAAQNIIETLKRITRGAA